MTVAAFDIPKPTGFVTDETGTLTATERQEINDSLANYKSQTSNEIGILIVPTTDGEDVADTSVAVFRTWGIGTKNTNNGLLLFIAKDDHKLWITPGYGMQGVLPDIVIQGIIDTDITPRFKDGDYVGGIRAGIDALQKHIGGEYTASRYQSNPLPLIVFFALFFGFFLFIILVVRHLSMKMTREMSTFNVRFAALKAQNASHPAVITYDQKK
jgi:uncharacterized protein